MPGMLARTSCPRSFGRTHVQLPKCRSFNGVLGGSTDACGHALDHLGQYIESPVDWHGSVVR
eukprot:641893-Alexandrium_andersonii.AAC.1